MIIPSPFEDVLLPDVTVPQLVLGGVDERSHHVAVVEGASGARVTYGELGHLVEDWAARLRGSGLSPGQIVVVSDANRVTTVAVMLAAMRIGAVAAPVHPSASADGLVGAFRLTGASMLLTDPSDGRLGGGSRPWSDRAVTDSPPFGGGLVAHHAHPHSSIDEVDLTGIALLPSSSGTGGMPKPVLIAHDNLVAAMLLSDAVIPTSPDEVVYCLPSITGCYGLTTALKTLAAGATLVFPSGLDATSIRADFAREQVTRASVIPTIVAMLARSSGMAVPAGRLRFILSGGSSLSRDVARRCAESLGVPVIQGYGLTEASPTTHLTPLGRSAEKLGSIGPCLPNTVARLVDPDSECDRRPGETGELWVRGPQVARGYLGSPAGDGDVFRSDGWLRTGDLMSVDDDGYFTSVDRIKDLIKFRAHQIVPAELEAVLHEHPCVAEAAVVGLPDGIAGELPVAFVVLRDALTTSSLLAFAAARLPRHARIRRIVVVDSLPKTLSGKVLRRTLRESLAPAR